MKKNFMTRALAVVLSAAMALSLSVATSLSTADAAKKAKVKLVVDDKTTTVTEYNVDDTVAIVGTKATKKNFTLVKKKVKSSKDAVWTIVHTTKKRVVVQAQKAGKSTITTVWKNNKTKKTSKVKTKLTVKAATKPVEETKPEDPKPEEPVVEVLPMTVKQTTASEVVVTFDKDVEDGLAITLSDAKVIAAYPADVNDKTVWVIKTEKALEDGKTYTVSYKDSKETFVASVGEPASIKILNGAWQKIGTIAPVDVAVYDENGIDITETLSKDHLMANTRVTQKYVYAGTATATTPMGNKLKESFIDFTDTATVAGDKIVLTASYAVVLGETIETPVETVVTCSLATKADEDCVGTFAKANAVNNNAYLKINEGTALNGSKAAKFYIPTAFTPVTTIDMKVGTQGGDAYGIYFYVNDDDVNKFKYDKKSDISYDSALDYYKYDVRSADTKIATVAFDTTCTDANGCGINQDAGVTGKFTKIVITGNKAGATTVFIDCYENAYDKEPVTYSIPVNVKEGIQDDPFKDGSSSTEGPAYNMVLTLDKPAMYDTIPTNDNVDGGKIGLSIKFVDSDLKVTKKHFADDTAVVGFGDPSKEINVEIYDVKAKNVTDKTIQAHVKEEVTNALIQQCWWKSKDDAGNFIDEFNCVALGQQIDLDDVVVKNGSGYGVETFKAGVDVTLKVTALDSKVNKKYPDGHAFEKYVTFTIYPAPLSQDAPVYTVASKAAYDVAYNYDIKYNKGKTLSRAQAGFTAISSAAVADSVWYNTYWGANAHKYYGAANHSGDYSDGTQSVAFDCPITYEVKIPAATWDGNKNAATDVTLVAKSDKGLVIGEVIANADYGFVIGAVKGSDHKAWAAQADYQLTKIEYRVSRNDFFYGVDPVDGVNISWGENLMPNGTGAYTSVSYAAAGVDGLPVKLHFVASGAQTTKTEVTSTNGTATFEDAVKATPKGSYETSFRYAMYKSQASKAGAITVKELDWTAPDYVWYTIKDYSFYEDMDIDELEDLFEISVDLNNRIPNASLLGFFYKLNKIANDGHAVIDINAKDEDLGTTASGKASIWRQQFVKYNPIVGQGTANKGADDFGLYTDSQAAYDTTRAERAIVYYIGIEEDTNNDGASEIYYVPVNRIFQL